MFECNKINYTVPGRKVCRLIINKNIGLTGRITPKNYFVMFCLQKKFVNNI